MAVQLISIALKHLATHEDGGVTGSVGAKKKKEQQPGRRHDEFLADGGGEKSDKPHKRTLGKKLCMSRQREPFRDIIKKF